MEANMRSITLGVLALAAGTASAQLVVSDNLTPTQLVQDVLLGSGVTVSNIAFNGVIDPPTAQPGSGSFTYTGSDLGLPAGVILSSGEVADAANPGSFFASGGSGSGSDPDLAILANQTINDRAVLEFDFVPVGDTVKFRYVFSSEEYPEYACTNFNDAFGFILSGPGITGTFSNGGVNIALIPGTQIPIAINTVNPGTPGNSGGNAATCAAADPNWQNNNIYYVDNQAGADVCYDGLTVVLEARYVVQCGQTYHIKMAIGDGTDSAFDSAVFLEAGSFTSSPFIPTLTPGPGIIGLNTILESCYPVTIDFTQTGAADDTSVVYILVGGTATAGVDYVPAFPDSLVFLPGDSTQSLTFTCPVDWDGQETIVLTLISQSDCADVTITNEFIFFIEQSPALVIVGGFAEIPCGGSTTLTPTVQGGFAPYTISWTGGSVGPTLTVSPLQNTVYTATVTDDCGTTSIAQFFVELTPLPPLVMTIIGSGTLMEACDQAEVNIIRPQGIPGDLPITFTFNGNAQNGPDFVFPPTTTILDGTLNMTIPFAPLEDGIGDDGETVTITGSYSDACGQTATASVTFTIMDAPFLGVETEDFIIECQPDSLLLVAEGVGGVGQLSYVWSTGDQGPSTYVTMQVPGNYTVTATDECGRTASDVAIITVICDVIIPNVITPNGDGSNDIFEIVGIEYVSNTVRIFNRWGQEVYSANNYRNQWNGGDLPDGTYYYEVSVSRKDEPYTGHLTILRNGW
jgi:gliding motility-associated-like protein